MLGADDERQWAAVASHLGATARVPGYGPPSSWAPAPLDTRAALVTSASGVDLAAFARLKLRPRPGDPAGAELEHVYPEVRAYFQRLLGIGLVLAPHGYTAPDMQLAWTALKSTGEDGASAVQRIGTMLADAPRGARFSGNDAYLAVEVHPTFGSFFTQEHTLSIRWIEYFGTELASIGALLADACRHIGPQAIVEEMAPAWERFAIERGLQPRPGALFFEGEIGELSVRCAARLGSTRETVVDVRSRHPADHAASRALSDGAVTALVRLLGVEAGWLPARIDLPEKLQVRGGERSIDLRPSSFQLVRRGVAGGEHLPPLFDRVLDLGAAMFPSRVRAVYRGNV